MKFKEFFRPSIPAGFCIVALLLMSYGCKKYPENNLWFKNPEKLLPFFDTHLTKYQVNGIDSLSLLNKYFGHAPDLVNDIDEVEFITKRYSKNLHYHYLRFTEDESRMIPFSYSFSADKKFIKIVSVVEDTAIFQKNLFIDGSISWEIVRLSRKGPFKIKSKLANGNQYEIEIE